MFKYLLTKVGEHCSPVTIHKLNATIDYLEVGRWARSRGLISGARVPRRELLFDMIAGEVGEKQVLYLEFGVYRGESLRYWSSHLRNDGSALHGFDSFEGLPERWNIASPPGHFSTNGAVPDIQDPRVRFFKGRFEQTLPGYVPPPHEVLVVNLDADLYSSTAAVLNKVRAFLATGSYLYFDELSDRHHELRAFDEFLAETQFKFRLVGATYSLHEAAFQRIR